MKMLPWLNNEVCQLLDRRGTDDLSNCHSICESMEKKIMSMRRALTLITANHYILFTST